MPASTLEPVPDLPRWLVVGFSGHRHLHGRDEAVRAGIRLQLDHLAERCPRLAGVCSAASGADTIFAEEMLARDADLSVVLPFDVDRFARDFQNEPADAWERTLAVLRGARQVDVVHQLEADLAGVLEADLPQPERAKRSAARDVLAYYEATARTVERSDVLLAVWDGLPGNGVGGTASAVRYANQLDKPCVIVDPTAASTATAVRIERADRFPAHDPVPPCPPHELRGRIKTYADALDARANQHAHSARLLTKRVIYLHLFASAFGAATLTFGLFEKLPLIPALLEVIVLGAATYLMQTRSNNYQGWLPERVKAEVCRTFLATWDIRRHPSLIHQPRPPLPDHPNLFHQLRSLRQADRSPFANSLEEVRATYLRDRVDGQTRHYREKLTDATGSFRNYHRALIWTARGSVVASLLVLLLLLSRSRVSPMLLTFEFCDAVLPLAVTAANVLLISQESARRTRKYGAMIDEITLGRAAVAAAPTWDALERAVTELEELLLQELIEWHSFVENTEHVH